MKLTCRFCKAPLSASFCDLGMSPPSNSFLKEEDLHSAEVFLPLRAYVCNQCYLVQLPEYKSAAEIFKGDYAYFSSFSDTWLRHAEAYVHNVTERFNLGSHSLVVEVASNDGYLLRYFHARGIPTLGIEPSANVAEAARKLGINTLVEFFGTALADRLVNEGKRADVLAANNVLAHVPDLNDFVEGIRRVLAPNGVATLEFPHLLRLIERNQFDTIYHEHFSYFSFLTVQQVFAAHGLTLFDVEELTTHGGSLRIYARHADNSRLAVSERVGRLMADERKFGLEQMTTYQAFAQRTQEMKRQLLELLIIAKHAGKRVVGYGAAAKGNTLLNYCGIRQDFVDFVVDRSPHKQGMYLPGTHIPILHPDALREARPDFVLILPWNLRDEVMEQLSYVRSWGGRFIVPVPTPAIFE